MFIKLKPLLRSRLALVRNFHLKPNTITVKFNNQRIFNSRYRFRFKSQQFHNLPVLVSLFRSFIAISKQKHETTIKTFFFKWEKFCLLRTIRILLSANISLLMKWKFFQPLTKAMTMSTYIRKSTESINTKVLLHFSVSARISRHFLFNIGIKI